jgi:hypothetical protein
MDAESAQIRSPFKRATFEKARNMVNLPAAGLRRFFHMPMMDPEARALALELSLPLEPPRREAFLAAIEERLASSPTPGVGQVMAAGRELQREFFQAPSMHGGQTGRRV